MRRFVALVAGLWMLTAEMPVAGPERLIFSIAGNGVYPRTAAIDDGVPAVFTPMAPGPTALDEATGDLYVVERGGSYVRRIDAAGYVTTVAGDGQWATAVSELGDGGPAIAARFGGVAAIALSRQPAGLVIYVADAYACRIRRILPSGIIETAAGSGPLPCFDGVNFPTVPEDEQGDGGPATNARLAVPFGLAVTTGASGAATLYIADTFNFKIRRVLPGGVIDTIAGNGAMTDETHPLGDGGPALEATFAPVDIAVGNGAVYFEDGLNDRIRRVSLATGLISSIAGNGLAGPAPDGSLATGHGLAGSAGLAVDAAGAVYFGQASPTGTPESNRVRRIAPDGIVTSVAGAGGLPTDNLGDRGPAMAASMAPTHITVASNGDLYITDVRNNRVRLVTTPTAATNRPPFARLQGPPAGRAHHALAFDGSTSYDIEADIAGYSWDFGDGGTASGAAVTHRFSAAGNYTVTLTIADAFDATDTASMQVVIDPYDPPVAIAGPDIDTKAGRSVSFDGSASIAGTGGITSYAWDFGDGTGADGATPTHVYANPGVHMATLTVTDADGLTSTDTVRATVEFVVPPTANAGPDLTLALAHTAQFDASGSTAGEGAIVEYEWRFGDGTTAATAATSHVYTSAGAYTVTLRVTDSNGLSSEDTAAITVTPAANAARIIETIVTNVAASAIAFDELTGDRYFHSGHRIFKIDTRGAVTRVAGNGQAGFAGDGGPAPQASFNSPAAIVLVRKANGVVLYVSDTGNHRIRRINPNGIVETIAGNGVEGFAGDGEPATAASLAGPAGLVVATDVSGTDVVYFADRLNHRIRVIAGHIIYTGIGDETTGELSQPHGLAVTADGTFYISELSPPRIRKFDGRLTTLAAGALNTPKAVAVDAAGAVFIADTGNHRIQKVHPNGVLETVAGTDHEGFDGDGGPASSATLASPESLAVTAGGDIYVGDAGNFRLRRIYEPGSAGSNFPPAANAGPDVAAIAEQAVSFDGTGSFDPEGALVYAWDFGDGRTGQGASVSHTYATAGTYTATLTVTDSHGVTAVDTAVVTVDLAEIPAPPLDTQRQITTVASGGPFVNCVRTFPYAPAVFQFWNESPPTCHFMIPVGLASSADSLYIATREGVVRMSAGILSPVVPDDSLAGFSGDGGHSFFARMSGARGLAFNPFSSRLYVAETGNTRVRMIDIAPFTPSPYNLINTFAGNGTFAFGGDQLAPTAASLNRPAAVAFRRGPQGDEIYIADTDNHRIRLVRGGIITTVAGNGTAGFSGDGGAATQATLKTPRGVAVGADGAIYISDSGNSRIRKVVNGVIQTIAGNGSLAFNGDGGPAHRRGMDPAGLRVDSFGNVYFADRVNHRVRRLGVDGALTTIAGTGLAATGGNGVATATSIFGPIDVELSAAGELFIADSSRVRVIGLVSVDWPAPAEIEYGTPLSNAQLNASSGIQGTFEYSLAAGTILSAGTHTLTLTFTPAPGLGQAIVRTQTLVVRKRPLRIEAGTHTREYARQLEIAATITGVIQGDPVGAGFTTAATIDSSIGVYDLIPVATGNPSKLANYEVTLVDGTLTITKAMVDGRVDDASREYGNDNPQFSGVIDDARAANRVQLLLTSSADRRSAPGTYPIDAGLSGDAEMVQNFGLRIVETGTLTVTRAAMHVVVDDKEREYGDPNPPLTGTAPPGKNGDDVRVEYRTSATPASPINTPFGFGLYQIEAVFVGDPTVVSNYNFTQVRGDLTIRRASLEFSADAKSRLYYSANPPLTGSFQRGPKNGDRLTLSFATSATLASPAGVYGIFASVNEPADVEPNSILRNYVVRPTHKLLRIDKVPLIITAADAMRRYRENNPDLTGTITGIVNNEPITATYSTFATKFSPVGTYSIIPAAVGNQEILANYSLTLVNGTLTVVEGLGPTYAFTAVSPRSLEGEPVTLTASVHRDDPTRDLTGTVTFKDGETILGSAPIEPAAVPIVGPVLQQDAGATLPTIFSSLLNDDFWADAIVLRPGGRLGTFINNNGVGFTPGEDIVLGGDPRALYHNDLDGDAAWDDFITADADGSVRTFMGNGDGTFEVSVANVGGPLSAMATMFVGDWPNTKLGLAVIDQQPAGNVVRALLGDAYGRGFAAVGAYPVAEAQWIVNLNRSDIVAVGGRTATVFKIQADGTLVEVARHGLPYPATAVWDARSRWLDLDGENAADLPIGTSGGEIALLLSTADGRYRITTVASPVPSVSAIEAANLGAEPNDFLVAGGSGGVWLMRNRGTAGFEAAQVTSSSRVQAMHSLVFTFDLAELGETFHTDTLILGGADPSAASTLGLLVSGAGGTATLTTSALGLGPHTIGATYEGDEHFLPDAAPPVAHTVYADPELAWPPPQSIRYGTPLGASELNATAIVDGTFTYLPQSGTIVDVGEHVLSVAFTPDDGNVYAPATKAVTITVERARPDIAWATPAPITYGTPVGSQFNATASVAGMFTYSPDAGSTLNAGDHHLQVTFVPDDQVRYETGTASVVLEVKKATPTVSWSNPPPIVYGMRLMPEVFNATSSVSGTFSYSAGPGTLLEAGVRELRVSFVPTDQKNYENAEASVSITVTKAVPFLRWGNMRVTYGTPFGAGLGAQADIPGTFTYVPAEGTVLPAGDHLLSASFVPDDGANYEAATITVTLSVEKATPLIGWDITEWNLPYGTPIGANQLNATANIAGTFTYSPAAGTVLDVGNSQVLTVQFVPFDGANYKTASSLAHVNVIKSGQQLEWPTPAPIVYGAVLGAAQLNAMVTVNGTKPAGALSYNPPAGTRLPGGRHTLRVIAADTADYNAATATVEIEVKPAQQTITWADPPPLQYGNPLGGLQNNATVTGSGPAPAGELSFSPPAGARLDVGRHTLTVTAAATNNYEAATRSVPLDVHQAPLSLLMLSSAGRYYYDTPSITWGELFFLRNGDNFRAGLTSHLPPGTPAGVYRPAVVFDDPANRAPNYALEVTDSYTIFNPAVAIAAIDRQTAVVDSGAFDVTITGEGFVPGCGQSCPAPDTCVGCMIEPSGTTVLWNEVALAVTFVSRSEIRARVPAALVTHLGVAYLNVSNPMAPGAAVMREFFITKAPTTVESVSTASSGWEPIGIALGDPPSLLVDTNEGGGTVTAALYSANPGDPFRAGRAFFDVFVAPGFGFTEMAIRACSAEGISRVFWFNGDKWHPASDQKRIPGSPACIEVTVNDHTSPRLADLSGTFFASVGDITGPSISIAADKSALWPPDGKLVPVVLSGVVSDDSGVESAAFSVHDEYSGISRTGAVALAPDGGYRITVMLPAARNGNDMDGRVFTITIDAADRAGNQASAATRVSVPHDQRK
jgi:PKD repeat protein